MGLKYRLYEDIRIFKKGSTRGSTEGSRVLGPVFGWGSWLGGDCGFLGLQGVAKLRVEGCRVSGSGYGLNVE